MKRLWSYLLSLCLALVSCTTREDARDVARDFLEAMQDRNVEKAQILSLPASRSSIALLDSLTGDMDPAYQFIDLQILPDSSHAVCRYRNAAGAEDLFSLTKIGADWFVDFPGI